MYKHIHMLFLFPHLPPFPYKNRETYILTYPRIIHRSLFHCSSRKQVKCLSIASHNSNTTVTLFRSNNHVFHAVKAYLVSCKCNSPKGRVRETTKCMQIKDWGVSGPLPTNHTDSVHIKETITCSRRQR